MKNKALTTEFYHSFLMERNTLTEGAAKSLQKEIFMILSTGMRTGIPAFYFEWFMNRIREGYICVRNPYFPNLVTKYSLSLNVADYLTFCTKNPMPILSRLDELKDYRQF